MKNTILLGNIAPYAGIAQLVEHLIRNEGVAGSSPVSGTTRRQGCGWQATKQKDSFFIFRIFYDRNPLNLYIYYMC